MSLKRILNGTLALALVVSALPAHAESPLTLGERVQRSREQAEKDKLNPPVDENALEPFEDTQAYHEAQEIAYTYENLSTDDLKKAQAANRLMYGAQCSIGGISMAVASVAQLIPLVSAVPFVFNIFGDLKNENDRYIRAVSFQKDGSTAPLSATVNAGLGSVVAPIWDILEAGFMKVTYMSRGDTESKALRWQALHAGLQTMRVNYTRLVGHESGCGIALARASVASSILKERQKQAQGSRK